MTNTAVPVPLPPNSRRLASRRVEVNLSRPHPRRAGSTLVYRTERFTTLSQARAWAQATRRPGERASLTSYTATDGWQAHAAGSLTDLGWTL